MLNLCDRPPDMFVEENDRLRRPLDRADVEMHLVVCARIERPKDDWTHGLWNGPVRLLELQRSGFPVVKPGPPVVSLVEVHAGHLLEYPMHHMHVMHVVIEANRLKNLTGHSHYKWRLRNHAIVSGCVVEAWFVHQGTVDAVERHQTYQVKRIPKSPTTPEAILTIGGRLIGGR